MSGEPELKPCPFCGPNAKRKPRLHKGKGVKCHECAAWGPAWEKPDGSEWNARADTDDALQYLADTGQLHDRIAALEAERDKLREALKPFARIASEPAVKNASKSRKSYIHAVILVAFLDAARAALAETESRSDDANR